MHADNSEPRGRRAQRQGWQLQFVPWFSLWNIPAVLGGRLGSWVCLLLPLQSSECPSVHPRAVGAARGHSVWGQGMSLSILTPLCAHGTAAATSPCRHRWVPTPPRVSLHRPAAPPASHMRPFLGRMQKNAFKLPFNSSCKSYFMLQLKTRLLLSERRVGESLTGLKLGDLGRAEGKG